MTGSMECVGRSGLIAPLHLPLFCMGNCTRSIVYAIVKVLWGKLVKNCFDDEAILFGNDARDFSENLDLFDT